MAIKLKELDLASISGPYQLLGLTLIAVEILLGYLVVRAESMGERLAFAVVMLLVLISLIYAVLQLAKNSQSKADTAVTPPKGQATEEEIASPAPETISAPDGTYLIDSPPVGWRVREMTQAAWIGESLGITDPAAIASMPWPVAQQHQILVFDNEKPTSITPVPGQTRINGRKFPTALELITPTQLAIIPVPRAHAPLFVEHPLEHNFLQFVGSALQPGVMIARNLEVNKSVGKRSIAVDLQQNIENAIVNGKEVQSITVTTNIIGVQGELWDYMFVMKFVVDLKNSQQENDIESMQKIVDSFRRLKVVNVEQKRKEIALLADTNYTKLVSGAGKKMFYAELFFVCKRVQGLNLDRPEDRLHAIKLLRPFEAFAQEVNLDDEDLNNFWKALHEAEAGNATAFKKVLAELLEAIEQEEDKRVE